MNTLQSKDYKSGNGKKFDADCQRAEAALRDRKLRIFSYGQNRYGPDTFETETFPLDAGTRQAFENWLKRRPRVRFRLALGDTLRFAELEQFLPKDK